MKRTIFYILFFIFNATGLLFASYDDLDKKINKEIFNCPDKETGQCYNNVRRMLGQIQRSISQTDWEKTYQRLNQEDQKALNARIVEFMKTECSNNDFRWCVAEADFKNVKNKIDHNKNVSAKFEKLGKEDPIVQKFLAEHKNFSILAQPESVDQKGWWQTISTIFSSKK